MRQSPLSLQRGMAIPRRLGVGSLRKFSKEITELIETGRSAEPRPYQVLQARPREALSDATGKPCQVITEVLRAPARLDEVPVRKLLRFADLLG